MSCCRNVTNGPVNDRTREYRCRIFRERTLGNKSTAVLVGKIWEAVHCRLAVQVWTRSGNLKLQRSERHFLSTKRPLDNIADSRQGKSVWLGSIIGAMLKSVFLNLEKSGCKVASTWTEDSLAPQRPLEKSDIDCSAPFIRCSCDIILENRFLEGNGHSSCTECPNDLKI